MPKASDTKIQSGVSKDLGARLREGRERKGFTVRGLARYVTPEDGPGADAIVRPRAEDLFS